MTNYLDIFIIGIFLNEYYLGIMYYIIKLSPVKMVSNVFPSIISAAIMGVVGVGLLSIGTSIWWQLISIILCIAIYFLVISRFSIERQLLYNFVKQRTKI